MLLLLRVWELPPLPPLIWRTGGQHFYDDKKSYRRNFELKKIPRKKILKLTQNRNIFYFQFGGRGEGGGGIEIFEQKLIGENKKRLI